MKNLRQLRRDAALTQYALAKATGIPRVKISHAELGIVTLSPDEIVLVRKFLLNVARKKSARVLRELDPKSGQ
jgi:transcriptional regulator with XRE-family HTH domain